MSDDNSDSSSSASDSDNNNDDDDDADGVLSLEEDPDIEKIDLSVDPDPFVPVIIIPRSQWGADPPRSKEPLCNPVERVYLMHTGTESCFTREQCGLAVKQLQTFYIEEKGLPDIPWNFLIGGDGVVYEGRGWTTNSSKLDPKCQDDDGLSLDVAYIGNYSDKIPEKELTVAADKLVDLGIEKLVIDLQFNMRSQLMEDFVEKRKT